MAAEAAEGVDAQARLASEGEGEIAAAIGSEAGVLTRRNNGHDHGLGFGLREGRAVDGNHLAVDAQAGGTADTNM